jgi:uncharacterized protein (TIGR03083 family)
MLTQQQVNDELRTEREILTSYLEALAEGAWDKESLCEGWRVRDVIAHIVGNAVDIAAGNTTDAGSESYNQRQIEERKGKTPRELLDEWKTAGPAFEDGITALDDAFWNAPYPPFGTVGQAVQRFVEDAWVHRQDIRIALGDGIEVDGPGLRVTLEVTLREMADRIPAHAPGVRSVAIEAGDFSDHVKIGDDGVDVKVSGDPAMVALVATGRYGLDKVTVTPEVPDGFATAFNIYAS